MKYINKEMYANFPQGFALLAGRDNSGGDNSINCSGDGRDWELISDFLMRIDGDCVDLNTIFPEYIRIRYRMEYYILHRSQIQIKYALAGA
jgi:hypothetical protein